MADLAVWQRTIVDEEGNVIPGAEIEVRREEDGSLATLYADRAGETPLANPLAADMSGFVRFFAQGDAYTITAVGAGSTRTWRFDPTGRLQEFDRVSDALVADDAADLLSARANLGTFSTVADVQNSHIPPVLDTIRTNGYYEPGDGGGAHYRRVGDEPLHPGKLRAADGAWWELAETAVTLAMFGGSQADLDAYLEYKVGDAEAGTLHAPRILPTSRGLKITEFMAEVDPNADHWEPLQEAIAALRGPRYRSLDLEGLRLSVSEQLLYEDSYDSVYPRPKSIINGTISAREGGNWNDDKPLLRLTRDGGSSRLEWTKLSGLTLQCAGRCSGLLIDGPYLFTELLSVDVRQPQSFGIRDDVNGQGGDLRMMGVTVARSDSWTPFDERITIGIDLYANDAKIIGCKTQYCKTGLHSHGGSLLMTASHFHQGGNSTPAPLAEFNPCVILTSGRVSKISTCYFDNSPVWLDMDGQDRLHRISFADCLFTITQAQSDYRFVQSYNAADASSITDLVFRGCTFRSLNASGQHPDALFSHRGGGYISPDQTRGLFVGDGCSFWNTPKQLSTIPYRKDLDGSGVYFLNFYGATPFNQHVNSYGPVSFVMSSPTGDVAPYGYIVKTSAHTATVHVKNDVGASIAGYLFGKAYVNLA